MAESRREAGAAIAVRVRCRSWEHFVELFSGELLKGQVFLPAKQPLALGTRVALTFELPDQTPIALEAKVRQVVSAGQAGQSRTGMWLSHSGLTADDAELVRARLKALQARAPQASPESPEGIESESVSTSELTPQDEPEIVVGVLPPHASKRKKSAEPPLHDQLRTLHATVFAMSQKDDLGVLGLDPTASAEEIRAAYLELSKRYHPHRHARLGSAEAQRVATDIYVRVQAAYGRLTGSHRVPQPEGGPRPRTQRSRTSLEVSEAATLLNYHQYDAALERLQVVLRAEPDHEGAQLWTAVALARKRKAAGDLAGAADAYQRVLELDAEHAEAHSELERSEARPPRARGGLLQRIFGKGD